MDPISIDPYVTDSVDHKLRERIKELTCLYGIAKITGKTNLSLDYILQEIVKLIPPAWQYPDITSAIIQYNNKVYESENISHSVSYLCSDININNEKCGSIYVHYSEEKPIRDEGPFLKEERNLLNVITDHIRLFIEKRKSDEDKQKLYGQLRHADRLATIGQLSAGVAHELNEPLGVIMGFSQQLKKQKNLTPIAKEMINDIIDSSFHAREIIRKLMLFARQVPHIKASNVDLNQIISDEIYFLDVRCKKENIKLKKKLAKNLPLFCADKAQMIQVLVNLIVNAIQAMPHGGRISLETKIMDPFIVLIVSDTGMGFDEETKKQIFLPFFTTKDINEGTGLGLAVVHGIVKSHGGFINVESVVGKGTTFEVQFPMISPIKDACNE